jgi:hypothetical protein
LTALPPVRAVDDLSLGRGRPLAESEASPPHSPIAATSPITTTPTHANTDERKSSDRSEPPKAHEPLDVPLPPLPASDVTQPQRNVDAHAGKTDEPGTGFGQKMEDPDSSDSEPPLSAILRAKFEALDRERARAQAQLIHGVGGSSSKESRKKSSKRSKPTGKVMWGDLEDEESDWDLESLQDADAETQVSAAAQDDGTPPVASTAEQRGQALPQGLTPEDGHNTEEVSKEGVEREAEGAEEEGDGGQAS